MKKKIIGSVFVVAFAMVAGYNVYRSQKPADMSNVALANVEALASGESDETGTLYGNAAGTRYCCCPGGSRTCGAARCSGC